MVCINPFLKMVNVTPVLVLLSAVLFVSCRAEPKTPEPNPIECEFRLPRGAKCPKNAVWKAGNPCNDACGRESMICPHYVVYGCFCKDEYRMINGKCLKPECCKKTKKLIG